MNAEPRYCCVLQVVCSMKVHVRNIVGESHGGTLADAHVECRIPCWTKLLLLICVHVCIYTCQNVKVKCITQYVCICCVHFVCVYEFIFVLLYCKWS